MKRNVIYTYRLFFLGVCILCIQGLNAQTVKTADSAFKTITPGPQYDKSAIHEFFWGKHYRREWTTPVRMKLFYLDTAAGGLTPYESGGSRQTKSLRLTDNNKREYVLRSIDKTFGRALPEIFRNTFIQSAINDQVSIAHPYAAVMVSPMAEAARIYHTWPKNVYLPRQKALDSFNTDFGNAAYLFEERPDGNWETAPNFGNAEKIIGTEKLFENLKKDSRNRVDQEEYVRARLFDIFVGDWGRHEDQWRWAAFENNDHTLYKPIPRDRDQTFTKFDGILLRLGKSAAGLSHQQTFDHKIKDIETYNFAARNLDRFMANEITMQQWINTARELQTVLTDSVISFSVRQMPPEVFQLSGQEIIDKLKTRRNDLVEYAGAYYRFLAEEVEVTGTDGREYFEIISTSNGVMVNVFNNESNASSQSRLIYQRAFDDKETKEIRLFGLGGNDTYYVDVPGSDKISVRVIGGEGDDEYSITSSRKVHVYDNSEEVIENAGKTNLYLSGDSAFQYKYESFKYDKQGITPSFYYSKQHIVYIGLAYSKTSHKWGRNPFANTHEMYLHYSPTQNALRTGYEGIVTNFIGNWNLMLIANYDWVKVINFFGLGNESRRETDNRDFYRIRSENGYVSAALSHAIGKQGSFNVFPFFHTVKLINDEDRFLMKDFLQDNSKTHFETKRFAGAGATLKLQKIDNQVIPTRGVRFTAAASYTKNINEPKQFYNFAGDVYVYIPFLKRFVLSIKNGAAGVSGEPEFYQMNFIGGRKLRGYRRERFWGNYEFHNNNELQYLFDLRSFLFNGKAGVMAFADQGRVWLKGENSSLWHYGYGGGIIFCPFNKVYISLMYGRSRENSRIFHIDIRRALK